MKIYEVFYTHDDEGRESEFYDNRKEADRAVRWSQGLAVLNVHEVKGTRADIVRLLRHFFS